MRNSKKEGGCGVFKILPVEVNTSLCGYSLTSCAKSVVEIERFLKKMQAFLIYIRGLDCVFRRKKIKKLANLNWLSNEIKITFYRMEVSYVYGLRDRSYLTFAIEYTPPGQKCSSWFAEKVCLYGITVRNNKKRTILRNSKKKYKVITQKAKQFLKLFGFFISSPCYENFYAHRGAVCP